MSKHKIFVPRCFDRLPIISSIWCFVRSGNVCRLSLNLFQATSCFCRCWWFPEEEIRRFWRLIIHHINPFHNVSFDTFGALSPPSECGSKHAVLQFLVSALSLCFFFSKFNVISFLPHVRSIVGVSGALRIHTEMLKLSHFRILPGHCGTHSLSVYMGVVLFFSFSWCCSCSTPALLTCPLSALSLAYLLILAVISNLSICALPSCQFSFSSVVKSSWGWRLPSPCGNLRAESKHGTK